MHEPKRARRRRDLQRMKARCRRIYPHDERASCANHLHPCSGPCCGNPRKWWGELTMQERRSESAGTGDWR